jgi:hypothetical protein
MCEESNKATQGMPAGTKGEQGLALESHHYSPPVMYTLGRSSDLVQGSTGPMYDDTGNRARFP